MVLVAVTASLQVPLVVGASSVVLVLVLPVHGAASSAPAWAPRPRASLPQALASAPGGVAAALVASSPVLAPPPLSSCEDSSPVDPSVVGERFCGLAARSPRPNGGACGGGPGSGSGSGSGCDGGSSPWILGETGGVVTWLAPSSDTAGLLQRCSTPCGIRPPRGGPCEHRGRLLASQGVASYSPR